MKQPALEGSGMAVSPEELGFLSPQACELARPVLRDPALEAEFQRRGHVTVPLLGPDEVARLYDGYARRADEAGGVNPPGAYNDTYAEFSIIHSRPDFRREVFELVDEVVTPRAADYLVDYRPLIANYVNKPPGTGVVPAHQNFSVVDERRFQSVSVWVALVDCEVENGAMLMLDGSHRRLRGRRGMWAYQAFSSIEDDIVAGMLTPVTAKAGDAVILDDALVHYSPPNTTDARRLAIQFVMVPREADALWFRQVGAHDDVLDVEMLRVDEPYFFDFWHGDGDARHAVQLDTVEVPAPALDVDTFRALVGASARPVAPLPAAEPAAPPAGSPSTPRRVGVRDRLRRLVRR